MVHHSFFTIEAVLVTNQIKNTQSYIFGCKFGCKKRSPADSQQGFAEREGFEPPVPLSTTVFKTVVIDHSTISPVLKSGCKGIK